MSFGGSTACKGRTRSFENKTLPGMRMQERKPPGMELERPIAFPVARIAHHGMSALREMHAYLVLASALQLHLDK